MKFQQFQEAAYAGNLGIMELVKFHRSATKQQKNKLQQHINNREHDKMRELIKHVTSVKLKPIVKEEIKPDILPKAGAGQDGTDTLVQSYMRDTPGQSYKKFKQYIK